VPHAVIDLDELARFRAAEPDPDADVWRRLTIENLRSVWPNYRALGIDRVILAAVVDSAATVSAYGAALGGADLTVCRVRAPLDEISRRLRAREPGTMRTFLLEAAPRFDASIAALGVEDFVVDNPPGASIAGLAREVLSRLRWA
jgi:hypothetical protein